MKPPSFPIYILKNTCLLDTDYNTACLENAKPWTQCIVASSAALQLVASGDKTQVQTKCSLARPQSPASTQGEGLEQPQLPRAPPRDGAVYQTPSPQQKESRESSLQSCASQGVGIRGWETKKYLEQQTSNHKQQQKQTAQPKQTNKQTIYMCIHIHIYIGIFIIPVLISISCAFDFSLRSSAIS